MEFIVGIIGNLVSKLIADSGTFLFQELTDNISWKKWKAKHQLSKNQNVFLDRYAETLVNLAKQNKTKELLQFYGQESVIKIIHDHWYDTADHRTFEKDFLDLAKWFTLDKQLDGFAAKEEIAFF